MAPWNTMGDTWVFFWALSWATSYFRRTTYSKSMAITFELFWIVYGKFKVSWVLANKMGAKFWSKLGKVLFKRVKSLSLYSIFVLRV